MALARVVATHPGQDNAVCVVTVKTSQGTYRRPVTKIAVLIPNDTDRTLSVTLMATLHFITIIYSVL